MVFVKHGKGEGKYETNDSGGGVVWCRRHVYWLEDFLLSQALDLTVWLAWFHRIDCEGGCCSKGEGTEHVCVFGCCC